MTGNVDIDAQSFMAGMVRIIAATGAPNRLRDVGGPADGLVILAQDAMQQTRLLGNNPVTLNEDDALRLYQQAY